MLSRWRIRNIEIGLVFKPIVFFILFLYAQLVSSQPDLFLSVLSNNEIPEHYFTIKEQLMIYKDLDMKVYYGGPVTFKGSGVKWIMSVVFSNIKHEPRAIYEVAFINCTPNNASGAEVIAMNVNDVDIKLRNKKNNSFELFSKIIKSKEKLILIRTSDVSMAVYPEMFIAYSWVSSSIDDEQKLLKFLVAKYSVKNQINIIRTKNTKFNKIEETEDFIRYKPVSIKIDIAGKEEIFLVRKIILKNDIWKLYYLITTEKSISNTEENIPLVRIDSGCVSGQIYNDDSCDCLEQLHSALKEIAKKKKNNDMVIHIPLHDGRGYGTAVKAETEIYKAGGKGIINSTVPLNTIEASKLLFKIIDQRYDIRSFDGVGFILKNLAYSKIMLLTDNIKKINAIKNNGINVLRKKIQTKKDTCKQHLLAKKHDKMYIND